MKKTAIVMALVAGVFGATAQADDQIDIYVAEIDLGALEIIQPSRSADDWTLTEQEMSGIQNLYFDVVSQAIESEASLSQVTDPAAADVVIEASLAELAPTAPKDDFKSRGFDQVYFTQGAGTITIDYTIESGDTVSTYSETRKAGHTWDVNDRFHNKLDVKQAMRSLATEIVDDAQQS